MRRDHHIACATRADLKALVEVHLEAFPDFFLSKIGKRFLTVYYQSVATYPQGCVLVLYSANSRLVGFISGFKYPDGFYRHFKKRKMAIAVALAIGLLKRPYLLPRVVFHARCGGKKSVAMSEDENFVELSALAVDPGGQSAGVGQALHAAFEDWAVASGAHGIYLTTDVERNELARNFYAKRGYREIRKIVTPIRRSMSVFAKVFRESGFSYINESSR